MISTHKLLRELIALPSVNPAFVTGQSPRTGEKRIGQFLAALGARAGLTVEFQSALPGRDNLLLRLLPKSKSRQRVLLAPHLDTVDGRDDQFVPRTRNGRMFGRGACDTKGSVAAMFGALCEVADSLQRPAQTEIVFAGLIDEENAQSGSRAMAKNGFKADLAIVGEPTELKIITAHKGNFWLKMETRGKSAHGARPELGRNAVHAMARIVDLLQTEYAAQLRRRSHPLLGNPTVSVGAIAGGNQANIVPDLCTILVDRRTLPGETKSSVWREINSLLRSNHLQARLLNDKLEPCLPLETDSREPLVARFLQSIGQRRPLGVSFFCDASVLAHGGIPSVVFGPGNIAQAHTDDEWVELRSVERAQAKLTAFLISLP